MAASPAVLAIINPQSGTATPAVKVRLSEYIMRQSEAAGYAPELIVTEGPGHATELAAEAVGRGITRVLAIGGDGTINETARALRQSNTALGIVPIGSGNGLARHLGVPLNPQQAVRSALAGRPVVIDSATINEYPFFCTAGFGFEAYVAHAFARQPVRGLPTYIRTSLSAFLRYQPGRYVVDGVEKELFSMTFANAGQFGNNAWMAPTANIADGRLEQCEVRPFPIQAGGILAWRLFNKSIDRSPYWHGTSVTHATVQADRPLLIHADGEPLTLSDGRADIRILPGSLLVLR